MIANLKLLLKNPLLDNYPKLALNNDYITQTIGTELKLPAEKINLPFIFSCFALSMDGKLCYPDNQSGFSIAQANHHATIDEKYADWWFLMLARSISDAIIIGSNSLNLENGNFLSTINITELISARQTNNLSIQPWTIIIVRSLDNLDLTQQLFTDHKFPILICAATAPNTLPPQYIQHQLSTLSSKAQLGQKNLVIMDMDYSYMFKIFKQLGFKVILNESPYLHHLLLEQQLLDEIWLNYSASYIGGNITNLGNKQKSFLSSTHPDTELLTLHHVDYHFLYSRQKVIMPG